MKGITRITLLFFLLGSAVALGQGGEPEKTIMALESAWSDMFGKGDHAGIAKLLAKDSVLIMPGAEPIVGIEDIKAATKAMLESDAKVSWVSDFAQVSASGDMAYDYGTATTRLPDGSELTGYYLVVWVKEDGEWKVAADMFN